MKKKIILTLSRVFPVTHSRKGEYTGFHANLKLGHKIHTIRKNYDLWALNAEKMQRGDYYLSIREWSGKPYNSPQVEIAQIHKPIGVQSVELYYHSSTDTVTAVIDGYEWSGCIETLLAHNDGLAEGDFKEWFFGKDPKEDKVFKGGIIHFTDFRY